MLQANIPPLPPLPKIVGKPSFVNKMLETFVIFSNHISNNSNANINFKMKYEPRNQGLTMALFS